MAKATQPQDALRLEQIPNVGPRIATDFRLLGIMNPEQLKSEDPYELYVRLCQKTNAYHDPCVLDTFIAAVYFMDGKGVRSWWSFTEERKKNFHKIEAKVQAVSKMKE